MAERKIINKNGVDYIVEKRDDGSLVTIGLAGGGQQPVTIGQPDPGYQYKGPKAAADTQRAQNEAAISGAQVPYAGRNAEADAQKAMAEAELARIRAQAEARADAKANSPQARIRNSIKTDETIDRINEARMLAMKDYTAGNTFGTGLFQVIPGFGQESANLGAKLEGLKGGVINDMLQELKALSETGSSGYGQFTQTEADRLAASIASLQQTQSPEELVSELQRLERHYRVGRAILDGVDPRIPQNAKNYGLSVDEQGIIALSDNRTPGGNSGGGDSGSGGGEYQVGIAERFATKQDKRFAALAQARFDKGANRAQMDALAREYGYPPFEADLDRAIAWREKNGRGAIIRAPESGYNDPSIAERAIHNIADSPVGGYFGGAANALTLGGLDELQGVMKGDTLAEAWRGTGENTAEANLRKSILADAQPTSNAIGNVSGGILGALVTGGLAGGGGAAATTFGPRAIAGDAMFGALYGTGESNDDRLGGALEGSVAGAGGGILGRGAMRSGGKLVRGVSGPAQALRDRGIPLTIGQIGESGGGALGRFVKRREDRLAGFSGIGDAIARRQNEGIDAMNRAAFREGMGPVEPAFSGIGEEGVEATQAAYRDAYSRALDGEQFTPDQQFTQGMAGHLSDARRLPAMAGQAEFAMERSIDPFIDAQTNIMSGRDMQKAYQELQRRAVRMEKSADADGPDAAEILRGARDTLGDMVQRQSPDVMPKFRAANDAYRNSKILQDAVARARNTGGRFTAAQLGSAATANAKKYGGRHGTTDVPFFELQRAAQDILPSKIPDSGTAGRTGAGDGIAGLARAIARNSRIPLYSDPVQDFLTVALVDRNPAVRNIGEEVLKHSRIGGLLGAPAFLPTVE